MRTVPFLVLAIITGCGSGCSPVAKSICAMPSNAHVWQGVNVSWTGKLFDSWAPPHGGGAQFSDERCGRAIKVYSQRPFFTLKGEYKNTHIALADVHIEGRIIYADGRFWIKPRNVEILSPWITGEALDDYLRGSYERRKQQRLLLF